jgi:hypothetical protein
MQLNVKIGDRLIRPSEHEQNMGLLGAVGIGVGALIGNSWLKLAGGLLLGSVAYSVWEESAAFVQPETMNAYFQSGGATSALGPREAGSYDTAGELAPGSYDTGAAAPVLAGLSSRRRRR